MSVDYAAGLSYYDDLGVCGIDEVKLQSRMIFRRATKLATLSLLA